MALNEESTYGKFPETQSACTLLDFANHGTDRLSRLHLLSCGAGHLRVVLQVVEGQYAPVQRGRLAGRGLSHKPNEWIARHYEAKECKERQDIIKGCVENVVAPCSSSGY